MLPIFLPLLVSPPLVLDGTAPPDVAAAILDLRSEESGRIRRGNDVLLRTPLGKEYLRAEVGARGWSDRHPTRAALRRCRDAHLAGMAAKVARWADAGYLDLAAEYAGLSAADPALVARLAPLFAATDRAIRAADRELVHDDGRFLRRVLDGRRSMLADLDRGRIRSVIGPTVTIPAKGYDQARGLMVADHLIAELTHRMDHVYVVREHLHDWSQFAAWWASSAYFNRGLPDRRRHELEAAFLFCNGPLLLDEYSELRDSLALVRGSFDAPKLHSSFVRGSVVVVAGDVTTPLTKVVLDQNVFVVGGKTALADGVPRDHPNLRRLTADTGLGVRFFTSETVGLSAAGTKKGVTVTAAWPDGRFRRFDVRPGDVILAVNGREPATADELTHLLREAVVEEAAVLRLRRDGAELTRIVPLAGVPFNE